MSKLLESIRNEMKKEFNIESIELIGEFTFEEKVNIFKTLSISLDRICKALNITRDKIGLQLDYNSINENNIKIYEKGLLDSKPKLLTSDVGMKLIIQREEWVVDNADTSSCKKPLMCSGEYFTDTNTIKLAYNNLVSIEHEWGHLLYNYLCNKYYESKRDIIKSSMYAFSFKDGEYNNGLLDYVKTCNDIDDYMESGYYSEFEERFARTFECIVHDTVGVLDTYRKNFKDAKGRTRQFEEQYPQGEEREYLKGLIVYFINKYIK